VRVRLRPAWTPAELAAIYAEPHDHCAWGYGHDIRVTQTIALAAWLADMDPAADRIADLSTGNAAIPLALTRAGRLIVLGDYAPRWPLQGPIEDTLPRLEPVDLYICSETLEHLDNPDHVLALIAEKAHRLILSTPLGETSDGNPEHYWGWDHDGIGSMLTAAGWRTVAQVDVAIPDSYTYQLWACTRRDLP
jgi:hypothetical protein